MRRFLGANLNINTSTSEGGSNGEAPLSSTRRAFQQTIGQLSYSRSGSSTKSNNSNNQQVTSPSRTVDNSVASSSSSSPTTPLPLAFDSPVPPTPPSKHGHTLQDDDGDDTAWDDALKLPFGASALSTSSTALSRAPSSASSANPYEGMIERMSNGHINNEEQENNNDDTIVHPSSSSSRPNQRTSTATISASRYNSQMAPSMQATTSNGTNGGPSSSSSPMLFSNSNNGLAVSATYAVNASSLVDLKDEMMLELLSSDALIHVAQFEILGFDEVEDLRKEHSILSNRLQSLQNKLAIETKIRDAALSISRLYSSKRLSLRQKQAAEEELLNADKKVDYLTNEVNKLSKKENEIKSRILRHMAAVLALSFRKLEAGQQGSSHYGTGSTMMNAQGSQAGFYPNRSDYGTAPSSVASSHTGPYTPLSATFPPLASTSNSKTTSPDKQDLLSPTTVYSPTFSTTSSTRSKNVQAFEGPHFFANNKDAVVPGASLPFASTSTTTTSTADPSSSSSARSPSFSQLALFASSASASSSRSHTPSVSLTSPPTNTALLSPTLSSHSTTLGYMDTSALETQIQDLTSQLSQSKSNSNELQHTIDILKQEKMELIGKLEELDIRGMNENESILRQLKESQSQVKKLRDELENAKSRLEENIKDAALWEEQSRKLHDGFQNERREMTHRLQNTLCKYSEEQGAPLGRHLPGSERMQALELSQFLSRDLEGMLSSMNDSHAQLQDEVSRLQGELSNHEQNSQQASSKTADEARNQKRQVDQLQQENQVLMKKITRIESENSELRTSLKELSDEHDSITARHAALQERYEVSASQQLESERRMAQKIQEVDKVHTERMLEKERTLLASTDQDRKNFKAKFDALQAELTESRNEKAAYLQSLSEVWKSMPSESMLQARLALKDSDDIAKYKAVYSNSAPSPTSPEGDAGMEPEKLSKRIQAMLKSDEKLVSKLVAHEDHAASHKAASIRAEKLLQESKTSLQAYSKQVKELEERMMTTDKKEVEMLERLNDLSIALETSRSNTKRSESSLQVLEKKYAALEKEKDGLLKKLVVLEKEKEKMANKQEHKVKIANLEKEAIDLRDELASAQDELDELRSRESRQRVQLLDELTQLTEEASSLRAQLRTAQRKLAAAGR